MADPRMRGRQDRPSVDPKVMKALGHPIRQKILDVLRDEVASPSEVAKEIGEPLGNVSYHFKILRQCDAVELVRTRPVRGALKHFYRASMTTKLGEDEWAALPDSIKRELTGQTLTQIWEHVTEAARSDGFTDPKSAVVRDVFRLDEQGYIELGDAVAELIARAAAIRVAANLRLEQRVEQEDSERLHDVELNVLLYHRAGAGQISPGTAQLS